jgi:hypothetical protein
MKLAAAFLLVLSAPAWAQCEASRQKESEVRKQAEAWWARHHRECTLCADGSSCREGFERRDGGKRLFEAWRAGHAQACAACGTLACPASEAAWAQVFADAKARHREKCRACEFDAARCEAWRAALEEAKLRHGAWKREHPAVCERCAPACPEWRARAAETARRHDEALQKHRERCAECKAASGACERPAGIRQDAAKERQALWRTHLETCACQRAPRR